MALSWGQPTMLGYAIFDVQNADEMGKNKLNLLMWIKETACSFSSVHFPFSNIKHHFAWINHGLHKISNLNCQDTIKSACFWLPFLLSKMFQVKITLQKFISKKNPSLFKCTHKYMQSRILISNWALIIFPKVWKWCLDSR